MSRVINFPLRARMCSDGIKGKSKEENSYYRARDWSNQSEKDTDARGDIFLRHENAERLDVPTTARSLSPTSLCTEDTVSRPFPVITIFLFSLQTSSGWMVTPCPTEHSTGEPRFGIASNWTVRFSSLVIRPACQNNNRRRRVRRPGRDAARWKDSQPAFQRW